MWLYTNASDIYSLAVCDCMMSEFLVAVLLVPAAACEELLSSVSTNDLLGDC